MGQEERLEESVNGSEIDWSVWQRQVRLHVEKEEHLEEVVGNPRFLESWTILKVVQVMIDFDYGGFDGLGVLYCDCGD